MAEKKSELIPNKIKCLCPGPGEYIAQTIQRETKSNMAPFLVSGLRFSTDKDENETPGPGAYDKNYLKKGWIRKFYKIKDTKIRKRNEPQTQLVLIMDHQDKDKDKRIISTNKSIKRIHFFLKKYHKKFIQIKRDSISNREMVFGYDIDKERVLAKINNPEFYRISGGDKSDSVGPGSYELEFPNDWHRTGSQWSKMKGERLNTTSQSFQRKTKYNIGNLIDINRESSTSQNKRNTLAKEVWKTSSNITKYNIKPAFKPKPFNDRDLLDFKLKRDKEIPGPGYYYEKLKTSFDHDKDKPKNSFVNTKTDKYKVRKNEEIEKIGPGTYFQSNVKLRKKKKANTIDTEIPFAATSDRFFIENLNNRNIGPGRYNINDDNSLIHKTFNRTQMQFGLKETRFPESKEAIYHNKDNPGPGSYINPYSNTGTSNTVECKGILLSLEKAKNFTHSTINPKRDTRSKETNPPVGAYNDDLYQTIAYENIKKVSSGGKPNEQLILSRKKMSYLPLETNSLVGPGAYFKGDKEKKPYQIHSPFNVSQKKFHSNYQPIYSEIYDINSIWNKPSFNINFNPQ